MGRGLAERTVAAGRTKEAAGETGLEGEQARRQELAGEALANEDFATAADLFERMGSPRWPRSFAGPRWQGRRRK